MVFIVVCVVDNSSFGGQRCVTNKTYSLWLLWVLEGSSECMPNFLRITIGCFLDQVSISLVLRGKDRDVLSVRRGGVRLQRGLWRHVHLKVVFTICYGVNGSVSHQRIQICVDNFQESEHIPQTMLQWKLLSHGEGPSDEGLLAESQKLVQSTESRKPETVVCRADFWELSSPWIKMMDNREEKEAVLRV